MKPERNRDEHILAEAICGLGGMIGQLVRELSQINNNQAILCRLAEMEKNIMSKISEFATAQNAHNDRQDAAVTDLQGDIQALNDKITELQNSPGGITPEDQALLDALQTRGEAISAKLEALAALTPPTPPASPA